MSFQLVSELNPLHFDFTVYWATIIASTEEGYYDQGRSTLDLICLEALTFLIGKFDAVFIKIEDNELWNIVN